MLNSSIWPEKTQRDLFITALLMAEPHELRESEPQLKANSLELTGWAVPPGWYGLIAAAGIGIIHRAMVDREEGMVALVQLGEPDAESKSKKFDGRRLVRINGGFIALNYFDYRDRDHTGAERSKRWRLRQKQREEEDRAKARADGKTIRPEHRDDVAKKRKKYDVLGRPSNGYETMTPRPPAERL